MIWVDTFKIHEIPSPSLRLLSDLTDAIAHSNTWASLAKRAAEVLRGTWPLSWLTLGWIGEDEGVWGSDLSAEMHQALSQGIQRALSSREAQRGWASGTSVVVIPLSASAFHKGYVALGQPTPLPDDALATLAKLLAVGLEQVRLIERIAALSRRAHQESRTLRRRLEGAQGAAQSAVMRGLMERVHLVASHETTVLIRGESGTGKEVLASEIHRLSNRGGGPFVKVNCGALPEGLVESELFGHERGAFTGAQGKHAGRFERAHGGTLLLDEVGELPLSAQVKLLRVLQEGEIERVGGEDVIKVNVRVIAATHQGLEEMVGQGRFRADLFYRLNVFPLEVPPLRERREDIPGLVGELLARIVGRVGRREGLRVGRGVMGRLQGYGWPGNVRELENALERAVILSRGEWLELPTEFGHAPPKVTGGRGDGAVLGLNEVVKRAIEEALQRSDGRIYGEGGAAALLGLKPSTLQSKMKKLGVSRRPR